MKKWQEMGLVLGASLAMAGAARADINIGMVVSETGPAASLGIPEKNAATLGPAEINGQLVHYHILDDRTDTTQAVKDAYKLVDQDHVDVILGATTVPTTMAIIDVASAAKTPMIAFAPAGSITDQSKPKNRWSFKTMTGEKHEAAPIFARLKRQGAHRIAFIGFADSFGDSWIDTARSFAKKDGIKVVADERYQRTDSSVLGQVLKVLTQKPDAVLIAASSGPAALPVMTLRHRGYRGDIYVSLGATFGDFVKIGGKAVNGVYAPLSPVQIPSQLPADYPNRGAVLHFVNVYESRFGKGSANVFAASTRDAIHLIEKVVPQALKAGQPGTVAFREALRSGIEQTQGFVGARGQYNFSPSDHTGLGYSALSLGRLTNGHWHLARP